MTSESAHILFPSDVPTAQQKPPEWFQAEQAAATARLMRTPPADDTAAKMFPGDAANVEGATKAAGPSENAANTLFPDDAKQFDAKPVSDFFSGFAASAMADGEVDRARDLNSAGDALIADARAAGMDAAEMSSALDVVRERQGDLVAPLTEEKMAADFASGMEAIRSEYGDNHAADLDAARAFIRDLEKVAPGTIASLNGTGAGNDIRLIRQAIREAKRRGYGAAR